MHVYGGLPAPLAAIAVLGAGRRSWRIYYARRLCGCIVALRAGGLVCRARCFSQRCGLLAELLRGSWFTGFPWGAGGYAHVDGPLAALRRGVGVYGIGAVAALLAFALAVAAHARAARDPGATGRRWRAALVLLAACQHGGRARGVADDAAAGLSVALLQGNIPQDEKFRAGGGIATALEWYGRQLQDSTAPLVVTPETAMPMLPRQLPRRLPRGACARALPSGEQAALVGIPLGNCKEGYTNSVHRLAARAAQIYRYDKHHLVPFGEFIPPLFRWFTRDDEHPAGRLQPRRVWPALLRVAGPAHRAQHLL